MDTVLAQMISLKNHAYPPLLKGISDAPKAIYIKGNPEALSSPSIAIVGTRKASGQGLELAGRIAYELASQCLAIVSGLAQGIDGAAHKGALEAHGITIAVLGSSLEERFLFPGSHLRLAKDIINAGGALVSEYEKNQPALRYHFVARNRIISGLSLGVVVVESPLKGGSLITAQFAKAQKRLVFAVPGSPFSNNARGTNALIKQGAMLVENATDILEVLKKKKLFTPSSHTKKQHTNKDNSPEEKAILDALSQGQAHIDKLAQKTKVEVAKLLATLLEMEINGKIKNVGGGNYVLTQLTTNH